MKEERSISSRQRQRRYASSLREELQRKPQKLEENKSLNSLDLSKETSLDQNPEKSRDSPGIREAPYPKETLQKGNIRQRENTAKQKKGKAKKEPDSKKLRFDDESPIPDEKSFLKKKKKHGQFAKDRVTDAAILMKNHVLSDSEDDSASLDAYHALQMSGEKGFVKSNAYLKSKREKKQRLKHERQVNSSRLHFEETGQRKKDPKAFQKKKLKKDYAAAFRGKQTNKAAAKAAGKRTIGKKAKEAVINFIKAHPGGIVAGGVILLLFLLFLSGFGAFGSMFMQSGSAIMESTYLSSDEDIKAADEAYKKLEAQLQSQVDNIESEYPGYDEYQYQVDEISHEPYSLISYLTAKYGNFKIADIESVLTELFQEQFTMQVNETVEIRTRTVTKTGTRTVTDPVTGETTEESYDYEDTEEYEWHILHIQVTNKGMDAIAHEKLNEDQRNISQIYQASLGNRSYLFGETISIGNPAGGGMSYEVPPEALSDDRFKNMITEAEKYLGYPYVWGGASPQTSFDCSGFVSWVVNHSNNGWNYGRLTAEGLRNVSTYVSKEEAKPGDLIFFQGTYATKGASHVGIYVGNGMMIHCGNPIQYASINSNYWQQHFFCFGRLPSQK